MFELTKDQQRELSRLGLQTPKMIFDVAFKRGPITNDVMRTYTESVIKLSRDMPAELIVLMALEVEGGECPRCGKDWNMIHVSNRFAEYMHFKPSCRCYQACPRCKTSMHREEVTGVAPQCLTCGYDPRRPSGRKRRKKKNRAEKAEEVIDE